MRRARCRRVRCGSLVAVLGVVWTARSHEVTAQDLSPWEIAAHTVLRLDLDGDGDADYLLRYDEEDYFGSSVLVAEGPTNSHTDPSLRVALRQEVGPYVSLVGTDLDRPPVLLVARSDPRAAPCDGLMILAIPDDVAARAVEEYERLAGPLDSLNFQYGGMPQAGMFNLGLTREVRFLGLRDGELSDLSGQFREHFEWRASVLAEIAEATAKAEVPDRLHPNQPTYLTAARSECARGLVEMMERRAR